MKLQKSKWILFISSIVCFFITSTVMGQSSEEFIDPEIPDSWYEKPELASEEGIDDFNQSPMLDKRVQEGELPPVEERLPEDPPVIEPYDEVGEYGGEAIVWNDNFDFVRDAISIGNMQPHAGRPTPDGKEIVPFMIKDWEFSEDYREITLYLREGVKWSDGNLFTADDYVYWWEHEANNELLHPVPPEKWNPELLDVTKNDKYSVTFEYGVPVPQIVNHNFQYSIGPSGQCAVPSHFLKQFHPDFVDKDEIVEMAEEVNLETWDDYYSRVRDDSPRYYEDHPEYEHISPVLRPYIVVERTETSLKLERNPYFPFVDTEGNQLPYIDEINVRLATDKEVIRAKASTGEATLSVAHLSTDTIPMYMNAQEENNIRTLIYTRPYGSDVAFQFNLSHPEENIREIFLNDKFRKAISLSIDRENINQKVYWGRAIPMQFTVPPLNSNYKEEYAQSYAEFDPEKAKELLDEIGMVDKNDDGWRETPEGDKFNPTLTYHSIGPVDPTSTLELAQQNFHNIGLDIDLRSISWELSDQRKGSNKFDVSYWVADNLLDITFGAHLGKYLAPTDVAVQSTWPGYVTWYETDGEEGMEPPSEIKQLIEWGETVKYSPDNEKRDQAIDNLLKSQAENLWVQGTVGMPPHPIVVNKDLKNIPEKGFWGWSLYYMRPMYQVQFYLDE